MMMRVGVLVTAVLLLIVALPILAHGGGELVVGNEPVGAYKVSVWVNPPQPRADQTLHMTVGIAGESDAPVLDAQVQIALLVAGSEDVVVIAEATTEQSINRLFYETDFPQVDSGSYDVRVNVMGNEAQGVVSFPLDVRPAGGINWVLMGLIGVGLIGAIVVLWSWRTQAKGTAVRQSPRSAQNRRR